MLWSLSAGGKQQRRRSRRSFQASYQLAVRGGIWLRPRQTTSLSHGPSAGGPYHWRCYQAHKQQQQPLLLATSCAGGRHNMPASCNLTFDLLTLKVVSKSRVTCATSVPILVFLGLSVLDLSNVCVAWPVRRRTYGYLPSRNCITAHWLVPNYTAW